MTHTINGIGTNLSGERKITDDELKKWWDKLPIKPYSPIPDFRIATESFVVLFIPIFPISTYVLFHTENGHYYKCFYPAGKGIYWEHVKSSYAFYIFPAIIVALMINYLIGGL